MTLAPGTRLGPYEIVAPLGAGGMGEVYRAKDTKLNRDVAIKVLPESFALDADRVARFTREAQVLASLNHPNIAAIYGIEEQGSTRALVMELVEGEDLSAHITRGAMPLADALPIAKQIADALEAAHEQGIVHRDLKPQNIKVRADGTVKVLDFGLAKALDRTLDAGPGTLDAANSPTLTVRGTQMGMIIGTAAYMAPEQAKGRAVDKRADIWAFGVVLYEMLTGQRAFKGDDVSETLASVLKDTVDVASLPASVLPRLRALIARCLERDPKLRLRDIGEARVMLAEPMAEETRAVSPPAATFSGRTFVPWAIVTVMIAAITGALVWRARTPPPAPEERLVIPSPTLAPPQVASISPDASTVAIIAGDRVWLRRLNDFTASEVAGSEGARAAFWSPDSATLGFQARGQLWRVSVHGGTPTPIAEVPDFTLAGGAAWTPDGALIYATGSSPLMRLDLNGGGPAETLFQLDPQKDIDVHDPSLLPGKAGVLFQIHAAAGVPEGIQSFSPEGRRTLLKTSGRATTPVYSPTGHLIYELNANVMATAFSLATRAASGEPILIAESARRPSVAADGTIVMLSGTASTAMALTVVDANGKAGATIAIGTRRPILPRLSPDKQMVAAAVGFGSQLDIWVFDLARHTERRLTFEPTADTKPSWSPDGKFIVYTCGTALCSRHSDGSGSPVQLVPDATEGVVAPDGKSLVFVRDVMAGIFTVALDHGLDAPPTATPKLVIQPRGALAFDVSPDGRFIAFASRDSGVDAVYVTRFPSGEGRWEIPVKTGTQPRWSPRGDRLFLFDELSRIVEVPVDLKTTFSAGAPQVRMQMAGALRTNGFDLMPDGTSFMVPLPLSATDSQTRVLVIRNWRPK